MFSQSETVKYDNEKNLGEKQFLWHIISQNFSLPKIFRRQIFIWIMNSHFESHQKCFHRFFSPRIFALNLYLTNFYIYSFYQKNSTSISVKVVIFQFLSIFIQNSTFQFQQNKFHTTMDSKYIRNPLLESRKDKSLLLTSSLMLGPALQSKKMSTGSPDQRPDLKRQLSHKV